MADHSEVVVPTWGTRITTSSTTDWEQHTPPVAARSLSITNNSSNEVAISYPAQSGTYSTSHAQLILGPFDSTLKLPCSGAQWASYCATTSSELLVTYFASEA